MLCLRRLQASKPLICFRGSRPLPPARLRELDAFCTASFHAAARLRDENNASPPEKPAEAASAATNEKKPSKAQRGKRKKKPERSTVGEKTAEENSDGPHVHKHAAKTPKVRKVASTTREETVAIAQEAVSKAQKRRERKAAQKATQLAAYKAKATLKASVKAKKQQQQKVADIGQVLERAVGNNIAGADTGNEAAEVLAEAAKHTTEEEGMTLKEALLGRKKREKKQRDYGEKLTAKDIQLTPIDVEQPPVPCLSYGLDRVLFNPGVYHLQDSRTRVYNFDPYLQKIMPVSDFNFDLLKKYITSSEDEALSDLARSLEKRYIGSTSSMTASLAHFHFLLSNWREVSLSMLSKGFAERLTTFTRINRLPAAIFLRWQNGTYAIDADKQYDTANVLTMLGRSMEKLLTLPTEEFERYRRGHSDQVSDEESQIPESYHYTTQGDMLMRSQLDAQDSRLPGTGIFDLKTRAVVSIRMDVQDWEENTGYQIKTSTGNFESFEREYYDMIRSTMLKYSLQARMGRMDGIFLAYHNIERIFGFQYVSIEEMDQALHHPQSKTRHLGDQEFCLSVDLFNKALNMATERFPETSIRFHFETREGVEPFMYIFAEPMPEEEVQKIQETNKARTEAWEKKVLGLDGDDEATPDSKEPREHLAVDAVAMPKLFEMSDEEPQWSSLAPHAQSVVVEKAILEAPAGSESAKAPIAPEAPGELLGLKLWTRNVVDGEEVKRVNDVTEDTEWTVDYHFEELSPADAQKRYGECKKRRFVLLTDPQIRDEDLGEEKKVLSYYQRKLRELSQSGRAWREQKDEEAKDMEKLVLEPTASPPEPRKAQAKEAVSVDGYMSWLFGKRE